MTAHAPVPANAIARPPTSAETARPTTDLFALGRKATAARRAVFGDQGSFVRSRQLLATGAWRGPRDAADSFVEEADLGALGGLDAAREHGVRTVLGASLPLLREAIAMGLRATARLPYRSGEDAAFRRDRLRLLAASGIPVRAVVPTPDGEPQGLDTLEVMAQVRLELPNVHVVADFARLGPRLAQMSLGFGADGLWGPIVAERALRLGANARNPAMTRKEAAALLRGAGLSPYERLADDVLVEVDS